MSIVINAEKIKFTGKKWQQKTYAAYSHYPGRPEGQTAQEVLDKHPERILESAVRRMVPRNRLGRKQMDKLKIYAGRQPSAPGAAARRNSRFKSSSGDRFVAEAASKKKHHLAPAGARPPWPACACTTAAARSSSTAARLEDFFTEDKDRNAVVGPLVVTEMRNRLDMIVNVHGGGITGQAGAICQGVARALKNMFGHAPQAEADDRSQAAAWPRSCATPAT